MNIDIGNLRVLVTAAGQGIGRAIAEAFLDGGARVHVCDIAQDRLTAFKAERPEISISITDVSNIDQVDACVAAAFDHMGGVDVLINNAGISGPAGLIEDLDPDAWRQTIDVNLNNQFYFMRRVLPFMKEQRFGCIVNISSTAGQWGYPNRTPYAASKWAIIGLTKSVAMEVGDYGIRVNAICPGSINNPRMDHVIAIESAATGISQDKLREGYTNQVSLRTFIDPEEIASMVLFICSPLGAKISGQSLAVDGHTETMRT